MSISDSSIKGLLRYDLTYLLSLIPLVQLHQGTHYSVQSSYTFLFLHPLSDASVTSPLRSSQMSSSLCVLPSSLFSPHFESSSSLHSHSVSEELSRILGEGLQSWELSFVVPLL